MTQNNSNYLANVREQYENLPYPPRNPHDEINRLLITDPDALDKLNFYCFEGKQDFKDNFRVLVAGGGTGDSAISWGEQLRNVENASIVYLDISKASMAVAQERARIRKLTNIQWVHGSILDLQKLELGKFNYINCSGVLHHLKSPDEGLACLHSVLKDNGAICIMVYAKYGRMAVYPMQKLMQHVNHEVSEINQKLNNCKQILKDLPQNHWFSSSQTTDHKEFGDSGIYDLLLHEQDRAYDVAELYDFVEKQSLCLTHMVSEINNPKGNMLFSPRAYLTSPDLIEKIESMGVKTQQIICELLHSHIFKHVVYLKKRSCTPPTIDNMDFIPDFSVVFPEEYNASIAQACADLDASDSHSKRIKHVPPGMPYGINFQRTKHSSLIFKYLDGNRSISDILKAVRAKYSPSEKKPTIEELKAELKIIFDAFLVYDWIFLRAPHIQRFKSLDSLQQSLIESYYKELKPTANVS